jgi:uracil-DNA glycosylase
MNTTIYHESWKQFFEKINGIHNINLDTLYSSEEKPVYPEKENVYRVFEMDVKEIKVVLLGQDPYHSKSQAHGLSFSVPTGIKIPPSLRNIFKELQNEFPERNYNFVSGSLDQWFHREKIFLLNASLTVVEGKPSSHMKLWETFTNSVIEFISTKNAKCVFLLLGNFAKAKEKYILHKENIINGVHPSPLSATRGGFFHSNIFIKVEQLLNEKINWLN